MEILTDVLLSLILLIGAGIIILGLRGKNWHKSITVFLVCVLAYLFPFLTLFIASEIVTFGKYHNFLMGFTLGMVYTIVLPAVFVGFGAIVSFLIFLFRKKRMIS